eukprot:TRINITY_DN17525_c0_g1_i1.p1 TRINITY_DN17525_c0_g1~~TRINITY_DN17525_c0_g1_i1.p1  ORF type:complete len:222 (-),score=70.68 TRINITY_DN17525_c0_g1_i1:311-976(-)
MHRIFGTSKPTQQGPSLDESTATLGKRVDVLNDKIRKCDEELAKYKEQMSKQRGSTLEATKRRALQTLKQKKMYEQQRDAISNQQFNLEQANFGIQQAKEAATTVSAMKAATKELKQQYKHIDINEVEKIHDDMADLLEEANEIQEAMGRSYGLPTDIDEADLDAELDALEEEMVAERVYGGSTPSYLQSVSKLPAPSVPASGNDAVDEFGLPEGKQKQRA